MATHRMTNTPFSSSTQTKPFKLKENKIPSLVSCPSSPSQPVASSFLFEKPFIQSSNFYETKQPEAECENAVSESLFIEKTTTNTTTTTIKTEVELEKLVIKSNARFADEPEYRMNHERRGFAVIINNKNFEPRLEMPPRDGTDKDASCLEHSLKRLGFDTNVFNNCRASAMREILANFARIDHSDTDCFVCVLLSHGDNGVVYGTDRDVEIEHLIQPFKYNRSLAGKPKIFIVQACRGSKYMEGVDTNPYSIEYVNKIPMEADFLIAYSTIAGYYSWRNSLSGSWFIQSLAMLLNEYGDKLEIMQLLTAVNRRVAFYYESNTNEPSLNGKRQVPCIVSMLTKELYFKPKLQVVSNR